MTGFRKSLFLRAAILCLYGAAVAVAGNEEVTEILVRYSEQTTSEEMEDLEQIHAMEFVHWLRHLDVYVHRVPDARDLKSLLNRLNADPRVEYAEPNAVKHLQSWSRPTDPQYSLQWYLFNSGQSVNGTRGRKGIDITWEEAMRLYEPKQEIVVAVLDSGVALNHPSFLDLDAEQTVLWRNPGEESDGKDTNGNGWVDDIFGWDFFDNRNQPWDVSGHGSLVAAIIAANAGNGRGGVGIAPDARIMSIRIFDHMGNVKTSAWIEGSTYAVRNGAQILNLSFGGTEYSITDSLQIQWLEKQNVLVVAAAGNSSEDSDVRPQYPASYTADNLLSVAAIDQNGDLADFSNYGRETVDVAAPGVNMFGPDVRREVYFNEDFKDGAVDWVTGPLTGNQSSRAHWRPCRPLVSSLAWLTDGLGFPGPPIDYEPHTQTYAATPLIDLGGWVSPIAEFELVYEREPRWDRFINDVVAVQVGVDKEGWEEDGWSTVALIYDQTDGTDPLVPRTVSLDLGAYAGDRVRIRFLLENDDTLQDRGIYLTDFRLNDVTVFKTGAEYQYNQGTSFAAPVVSGIGALVWAQKPELRAEEVALILRLSAENNPYESLRGRLVHEGSVDARNALLLAERFNPALARISVDSRTEDYYELRHKDFGYIYLPNSVWGDWAYSENLGWMYVRIDGERSAFCYVEDRGWLWIPFDGHGRAFDSTAQSWFFIGAEDTKHRRTEKEPSDGNDRTARAVFPPGAHLSVITDVAAWIFVGR